MSEKYKPSEEEVKKAEEIMEAEGLEERSQAEQDAFEAGESKKEIEKSQEVFNKMTILSEQVVKVISRLRELGVFGENYASSNTVGSDMEQYLSYSAEKRNEIVVEMKKLQKDVFTVLVDQGISTGCVSDLDRYAYDLSRLSKDKFYNYSEYGLRFKESLSTTSHLLRSLGFRDVEGSR